MTKHVFLMDVTRHKGPVQGVLQTARTHAESFSDRNVIWFHAPTLSLPQIDGEEHIATEPDGLLPSLIGRLQSLAAADNETKFHVISYDGSTLRAIAALKWPASRLKTDSFSSLKRALGATSNSEFAAAVASYEPMPVEEATKLTQAVLRDAGHTSSATALLQNRLRGILTRRDIRAAKNPYMHRSKTLISDIVDVGLREGWLGQRSLSAAPGTEAIWFIEPAASAAQYAHKPLNEAARAAEEKTNKIVTYLKEKRLYAPKDIRDLVLESLLKVEVEGLTISKLFRAATSLAQQAATSQGINFEHWRPAVDSVTNLAIMAGIFFDVDGRVIGDNFSARGTVVSKVKPEAIDACDGCLVVAMIAGIPGLTNRDAPAIAHAIFKEAPAKISQDDMIDRVHDVLSQLGGKLDQSADGVLSVI